MVVKSEAHRNALNSMREAENFFEPFIVACESTRIPMLFTDAVDARAPISFANESLLHLTGYALPEILNLSFFDLISKDNDIKILTAIHKQFEKKTGSTYEVECQRKDRSLFWATVFVNPIYDRDCKIVHHFASLIDLSKHKEEQAQLKMLVEELNHRVKNTLTNVQSIIRQVVKTDAEPKEIRETLSSRITALSRSHELLSKEKWKSASMKDIVCVALDPFRIAKEPPDRIKITGPNTRFPPNAAVALAIVLNELATNALKYGSLSVVEGRLEIDWKIEGSPSSPILALLWREFGGPTVVLPKRVGFGMRVIERGLAHELKAVTQVKFLPEGLVCEIRIPLSIAGNG